MCVKEYSSLEGKYQCFYLANINLYFSEETPFPNKINIILNGTRNSPILGISNTVDAGNKVLAVFGEVRLFGQPRLKSWVRLGKVIKKS